MSAPCPLAVMDAAIEGIGGPTDLGLSEARAAVAELIRAAHGIAGRVEQASRSIHDSTRWEEETMYSPDGSETTIIEWIFADLDAALTKFGGAK